MAACCVSVCACTRALTFRALRLHRERLEKTKATGNPKLSVVFDRLDGDLREALAAIASSSESLEKARQMDIGEIPVRSSQSCSSQSSALSLSGISTFAERAHTHTHTQGIDRAAAKLARLQQALDGLESDEVITSYLSDKSAIKVREGADRGNIAALKQVEKERQQWPPYMVMTSWDFADYRGNTAVHLATKNGHAECLEFLLLRGAQPSLVNAQGQSALHMATSYDIAKLLLKHNADPVVVDQMGRTPYDVHKANRMGGARGVDGKLVVDAFALSHQKVTGSTARSILKERNMSPEEKAARAAARKAKEDEEEEARQKKERAKIARSSYSQGLGALVVREFDYAVESFVTCLENDPAHSGAMLKLAKMAADGDSSAAAALDRLHAENEAAEAAEAAEATAATTSATAASELEAELEPELILVPSPSHPSLDGRAAAPIVTGSHAKTRSVLHSVESIPLSPMLSRGRPSSLVPTPPPTASGGLPRSTAVPTMSPRAPPPAASVCSQPSALATSAIATG